MRMRKKKNLNKRLEESSDNLIYSQGELFYNLTDEEKNKMVDCSKAFGNDKPLHLELGCGKGSFVIQMAKKYPHINFIAVEKLSNVIVTACEDAKIHNLTNLKFLNSEVENLNYFFPNGTVDVIYLNFSCPYPKNAYANRRMTHAKFLNLYKNILKFDGEIHQKTDGQAFFEFSLQQFSQENFIIQEVSLDLHASDFKNNVMTEYEKFFVDMGKPIYRTVAKKRF